ncbi:MAG: hypothetical protein C6W59_10805, partial [Paenibacillaceae bacterium]
ALALAGIPPLSGFWSKDAILAEALHANPALFVVGIAAACGNKEKRLAPSFT